MGKEQLRLCAVQNSFSYGRHSISLLNPCWVLNMIFISSCHMQTLTEFLSSSGTHFLNRAVHSHAAECGFTFSKLEASCFVEAASSSHSGVVHSGLWVRLTQLFSRYWLSWGTSSHFLIPSKTWTFSLLSWKPWFRIFWFFVRLPTTDQTDVWPKFNYDKVPSM